MKRPPYALSRVAPWPRTRAVLRWPHQDGLLLERPDHLEAGAVAHVGEARVAVAAEVPLEDPPVRGPIEEGPPALQLEDPLRRLLGVQLGHAPVVQHLAAAHGVAEVDLPVVLG